jgi:hypothetical protein
MRWLRKLAKGRVERVAFEFSARVSLRLTLKQYAA